MKKILAFLCTAMICMGLLTACGEETDYAKYFDSVTIYSGVSQWVECDQNTGVMYLFVKSGYGLGITPIYNTDGTPKIYEGWQAAETTEAK